MGRRDRSDIRVGRRDIRVGRRDRMCYCDGMYMYAHISTKIHTYIPTYNTHHIQYTPRYNTHPDTIHTHTPPMVQHSLSSLAQT